MTESSRKILIVDDHVDTCELMSELLRARGFDVRCCATAADALDGAVAFTPDAVIVDVELPDLDGLELVRRLRARGSHALRIIVLTGHVRTDVERRALDAGADLFLGKPVTSARLVEALRGSRANLT